MTVLDTVTTARPDTADWTWTTRAGLRVTRRTEAAGSAALARTRLEAALDGRSGMLAFQGEHRAVGYVDPPLVLTGRGEAVELRALNARGRLLLPVLRAAVAGVVELAADGPDRLHGRLPAGAEGFREEDRTRHAGVFTAVRALTAALAAPDDALLGLYGAFGYDLVLQLQRVTPRQERAAEDRDLVLHLPDEIVEFDLRRDEAVRHRYAFEVDGRSTADLPGGTPEQAFRPGTPAEERDHRPGEYAEVVARAMPLFRSGDLFEVVPGQVFRRGCPAPPSELFRRLRETNPAPHSLLMNLGGGEYLVGASPEMFVRVRRELGADGDRLVVESAPISGTAARGRDAVEDAERIRELLSSEKEESELTMCTDVDRNDKARVCLPGTVRITARRSIELYSTLIHTVDRVEGVLAPDRDALDGFLTHLWAVTVTGAPKLAAVEFLEREERSPRRWYGGAVGRIGFDGTLETVLTLRTVQIRDGVATVRAGATLLHDSVPAAEEAETELKAAALLNVLRPERPRRAAAPALPAARRGGPGEGRRILLIDHRDSFVQCLADYLRRTGATVDTYRAGRHLSLLKRENPDLVVLSPGPGRPHDFAVGATIAEARRLRLPVFGVCLGLQGMVEYFGGQLGVLDRPVHGKPSTVQVVEADSPLLAGLPGEFRVGRYHSLYALPDRLPAELRITARTADGVPMAIEHREEPLAAVQFHPESLMSGQDAVGERLIGNAVAALARRPAPTR
ncbi:anthranilate synthase component I [Streptomyces sp. TLI_171]|uniref:anthranilate synthase component I n=1 Tax=Streptomyces sp. TLI_171 TaxID=1938859 RepID=UPI000C19B4B8|nr:anthranilate synthase component I [Streptomyces sp. TLI_171]RKE21283.1 anthranilate synthase component I [Streptomyces sp. TLI_171]